MSARFLILLLAAPLAPILGHGANFRGSGLAAILGQGANLRGSGLAHAQAAAIQLKVRTNKTAIWVGDKLEYTVRVEHSPETEFVLDHLKKEDFTLPPFEVLYVHASSQALAGGRRLLEVTLGLTTFETGNQELAIPGFNLYYFNAGRAGPREEAQAQVLSVPPFPVGLRSTLAGNSQAPRDFKELEPEPAARWWIPGLLALFGLVAIGSYVARRAVGKLRLGSWRERKAGRRARKKSVRESLGEMRQIPADSPEDLEKFYHQASELLRNFAASNLGDGAGLTPKETEAALLHSGAAAPRAAAIGRLLEQCDHIRYAPEGYERGRSLRHEFLEQLEALAREENAGLRA